MNKETEKKGRMIVKLLVPLLFVMTLFFTAQNFFVIGTARKWNTELYDNMSRQILYARAQEVGRWFNIYINDLRIFTETDAVKTGDTNKTVEWLMSHNHLKNRDFDYVFFADRDGITYVPDGTSSYIGDRPYFSAIMKQGLEYYIGNPVISRTNNKALFHVARAAKDANGKTFGLFAGTLTLDTLQDIVNGIGLGGDDHALIIDGTGKIIAGRDRDLIMKSQLTDLEKDNEALVAAASHMNAGESYMSVFSLNKQKIHFAYTSLPNSPGWSIGLIVPDSQVQVITNKIRFSILSFVVIIAVILFIIIWIALRTMVKPIIFVQKTVYEISEGDADLRHTIDINRNDEIGRLVDGFNRFVGKLRSIIGSIKKSKEQLINIESQLHDTVSDTSSSITQILSNIESIGRQVEHQASSVEETAGAVTEIAQNIISLEKMIQNQSASVTQASAAVEQMIGNINSVDSSVERMSREFSALENDARLGVEKQTAVSDTVSLIASQSEMLMEANTAIANIASQTNMLAMNAAIEAAHAGEAGKGFSVVADEIRKLSETSAEQSQTIGDELEKILHGIQQVVNASRESEDTFNSVSSRIVDTDMLVRQIRQAMAEQQEGSKQIFEALRMMNDSTAEVRTASAEMSEGNKAILEEVKLLQESTVVIKDSMTEMTSGAQEINKTSSSLSSLSSIMNQTIQKIGSEIDLFQV